MGFILESRFLRHHPVEILSMTGGKSRRVQWLRLFEYQAKQLFRDYEIPVPKGSVARNPSEAVQVSREIGFPLVLKAQVLVGGRGKAGAVEVVREAGDLGDAVKRVMEARIGGVKPTAIFLEQFVAHDEELYVSIALERSKATFLVLASRGGGIEVDVLEGKVTREIGLATIDRDLSEAVAKELGLNTGALASFSSVLVNLSKFANAVEAELAEINPLALTHGGEAVALDAKVIVDDNALFRHPEIAKMKSQDVVEEEASRQGFSYVPLDGDIAVIGNGAGLVLSTLDAVADAGLAAACFLDLGGGSPKERIFSALKLANALPNVRTILINVFGGITKCTDVAEALQDAKSEGLKLKPLYIRLSGSGASEAKTILRRLGMEAHDELEQALAALRVEKR